MRYYLLSLAAAVVLFAGIRTLQAHCQMPCGIYDDQMRVHMIEESCATIEKAMDEIRKNTAAAKTEGEASLAAMQAVRWIATKEEHAAQIQEIVADYFLTQRIKPDTQNYDKKLELLHGILISAMKCRQTLDSANVQSIRSLLDEFSKLYFGIRSSSLNDDLTKQLGVLPLPSTIVLNLKLDTLVEMVSLPPGVFEMGSWTEGSYEQPHEVALHWFYIGRYEITQAQYQAVMGSNPSNFTGDTHRPVEQVSWYDAVTFCNKLSEQAGLEPCYNLSTWECDFTKKGYRLPTEAEWEYACRAETKTTYYTGDTESDLAQAGWYEGNSGKSTHPVGLKKQNFRGLYDMHGNVFEWCQDWYGEYYYNETPKGEKPGDIVVNPPGPVSGSMRVIRGGSWEFGAKNCRSAYRYNANPGLHYFGIGFRVVRR